MESEHMTAKTITIAGARGGSGTSTIAAAVALLIAGHASTELVAADPGTTAALLGLASTQDSRAPIDVTPRLALTSTSTGSAEIDVVVETRNANHVGEIVDALNQGGFPTRLLSSSAMA